MKKVYKHKKDDDKDKFVEFLTAVVGISLGTILGLSMAGFFPSKKMVNPEDYAKTQQIKAEKELEKQQKIELVKQLLHISANSK